MSKQKQCSEHGCNLRTIPGLHKPLCQYHYDRIQWGEQWAKECNPQYAKQNADALLYRIIKGVSP